MSEAQDKIRALQERRAAIVEQAQAAADEQTVIDLEAIADLEQAHGPGRIKAIELPAHVPGLPMRAAVKVPSEALIKRFRAGCKGGPDDNGDPTAAGEQLALSCLVYPDRETYARLCAAFPVLAVQLGNLAIALGRGAEDQAAKS